MFLLLRWIKFGQKCCLKWNSRTTLPVHLELSTPTSRLNLELARGATLPLVQHATFDSSFARRVGAVKIVTRGTRFGTCGVTITQG
jgi:hypothetical protein